MKNHVIAAAATAAAAAATTTTTAVVADGFEESIRLLNILLSFFLSFYSSLWRDWPPMHPSRLAGAMVAARYVPRLAHPSAIYLLVEGSGGVS